ncbi:LPS export ABC transporter periplasmic protein LptC [Plasticicumulans acidivorans]|uniref:Lipopolysaccharide export system protein LptC n=1 Tax=Plasticicumulans acidivorans TaxID=886464 RepID=A0A317MVZ0_9GAMM|nr:LPS export ABC transporter periplasmic protein LptC [Plasticicumulans acidivorans]PWV61801.1 lipopolysaccharide export system protein LptC [Plasticicumulans acidivorans]
MQRGLLALLLLAILAGLSGWFLNELERELRDPGKRDDTTPVVVAANFFSTQMNVEGLRSYTLSGPHLEQLPGDRGTFVTQPIAHTFEVGQPIWEIHAETGWVAPRNEVIDLRGAVRAERPASTGQLPLVLETRNVRLIPSKNYAETAEPAHITSPDGVVDAVGFRVWLDEDRVELISQVRGTYAPPPSPRNDAKAATP